MWSLEVINHLNREAAEKARRQRSEPFVPSLKDIENYSPFPFPQLECFIVVKSLTRSYGYTIQAPRHITWATGPQNTFGWYRLKADAQQRANVFNRPVRWLAK